jgi:hypothetical protein
MIGSAQNRVRDFDPAKFSIIGFCDDCDHSGVVPRVDESMTIPALKASLRRSACGSRDASIQICYAGAGEFPWGGRH